MKLKRMINVLVVLASIMAIAACGPTFSREALDQVDRSITFRELQNNPDLYQGKSVMLAGVVVDTRNTADGSFVEVLQKPMDRRGRPRETDETEGRFLITSPQFLDAAVYQTGRRISVIGPVSGRKISPLGEMQYRYPVVSAKELQLWEPRTSPQFSFGVGVGVFHGF